MIFSALFFDGKHSAANVVRVNLANHVLSFEFNAKKYSYAAGEFNIHPALGSIRRMIELNDGCMLETQGDIELPVLTQDTRRLWRWVHLLENNLRYVLAIACFVIASGWGFLVHGMPYLSGHIVAALPLETESAFGKNALRSLDYPRRIFQPSALSPARQAEIQRKLVQLCAAQKTTCPAYTLHFRRSAWLGANAVALPGGILVLTDELHALAVNDQEILSVLAHELGHVMHRHPMQQVVSASVTGVLMFLLLGDVESLATSVPAALMQLHNSRQMENEGDAFALHALQHACIPPVVFARILERLSLEKAKGKVQVDSRIQALFSTHPDTASRLRAFKEAGPGCTFSDA
jgi:Zn-dependent protease with chaperone function